MASILVAAAKKSALVATLEERQKDVAKRAATLNGLMAAEKQATTHAAIVDGENSPLFGIANVGNTCFFAASLQLLAAIPSLALSAANCVHQRECNLASCWYCELENAISMIKSGECVYDTHSLRDSIKCGVGSNDLRVRVSGGQTTSTN
jgi:hypothetical protein